MEMILIIKLNWIDFICVVDHVAEVFGYLGVRLYVDI